MQTSEAAGRKISRYRNMHIIQLKPLRIKLEEHGREVFFLKINMKKMFQLLMESRVAKQWSANMELKLKKSKNADKG